MHYETITNLVDCTATPTVGKVSQIDSTVTCVPLSTTAIPCVAMFHSVRVRSTHILGACEVQSRFETFCKEIEHAAVTHLPGHFFFGIECLAVSSNSLVAQRLRELELRRLPLNSADTIGRIIVLQYVDSIVDVVVSASRRFVSEASLRGITDFLAGISKYLPSFVVAAFAEHVRGECSQTPCRGTETITIASRGVTSGSAAWKSSVTGVFSTSDQAWDISRAIVATSVALGRLYSHSKPTVVVIAPALVVGQNIKMSLASDDLVISTPIAESSLGVLAEHVFAALTAVATSNLSPAPNVGIAGTTPIVGAFFPHSSSGEYLNANTQEYVPYLDPPFPITLTFENCHNGRLECEFREGTPDSRCVDQFASTVAQIYTHMLSHPDSLPTDVPLAAPGVVDGLSIVTTTNGMHADKRTRIDELFSRIAAAQPNAVAANFQEYSLTYGQLNERAELLGQKLIASGINPKDYVGVYMQRSLDLLIALLAVLKAGAAYIPFDPTNPLERTLNTVSDAGLKYLLTDTTDFPCITGVKVYRFADLEQTIGKPSVMSIGKLTSSDPAYVIFTSGSTGRPKGVVIPHINVVELIDVARKDFQASSKDVWTFFHSAAFDFSVWEIWGCLLTGGRLVIVPYWVARDTEGFYKLIAQERVTVLNQTPSAFTNFSAVDAVQHRSLTLRLIIFGGEPLDSKGLTRWLDRHPESACRLVNMYGITETTVHVTAKTVTRRDALAASRSVGKPIRGWTLYILDDRRMPVPIGVPGEIYVGGVGVSTGYLNQPELTSQRFVEDPFVGGMMYRSGDAGRMLFDGEVEHLGRLDNQIKLRGFRIELDEIKSVLSAVPGITSAAVTFRCKDPSDSATARIDAYVVGSTSRSLIRAALEKVLPNYMWPATITILDALPLTTNGKVDLTKLSIPDEPQSLFTQPNAFQEEMVSDSPTPSPIAQAWETVLGVRVGLDDNFFELGGNSLLAVRLCSLMRELELPSISVMDLYVNQTVRGLSSFIEGAH